MSCTEIGFIPVIDLAGLFSKNRDDRRRVGRQMGIACEQSGFLVIVNHRISEKTLERMYSITKAFFGLPMDDKARVKTEFSDQPQTRTGGYRASGVSALARTLDVESPPDLVETFSMLPPTGPGRNKWPDLPAEFERVWTEYYRALDRLAMQLMQGFALALDLPEDWFDNKFDHATKYTTMLANYYPPQASTPLPGQLRRGAHTDYGSLTILFPAEAPGGLQVKDSGGIWRDTPHVPGSFIVNIGDLMARWTNDRWVSTLHRVVNPARQDAGRDRLTIPFFHQPDAEAVISCIPSCQGVANASRYPPVTSGEWYAAKSVKAAVTSM